LTIDGKPITGISTQTVTFTQNGNEVTRILETNRSDGRRTTVRWTAKLDGKDYPTEEPGATVSLKQIDTNTVETTYKKDGKVFNTSTRVVSKDGKFMRVTSRSTDEKGQQRISSVYFDREQ
jgi:hypothetical protein